MTRAVLLVTSILFSVSSRLPAAELPRVEPKAVGLSEKALGQVQPGLTKRCRKPIDCPPSDFWFGDLFLRGRRSVLASAEQLVHKAVNKAVEN
jgi:hypothetical protein